MSNKLMKVFLSSAFLLLMIQSCSLFNPKTNKHPEDMDGKVTIRDIEKSVHKEWFNKELYSYIVDTEVLSDFDNNPERLKQLSVKIFIGTWCHDSQRELPRFYNIMRFLNVTDFEIISLDRNKKSKEGYEKGMNIHHVPTFIFYLNGKEINRIIEKPKKSLEKDLIAIVQAKKYTPNYE